ncbi:MAG: hypothetical protein SFX73_03685 [Kofleriaceae bacterium]|nr:hypothetical protein [Kofleriaceae bacterium]
MRLGAILVAAGIIDQSQLERALQAQVMLGARLGTCLVELGLIDLDGLANALSHQHGLPAALASHFERANPTLQLALDANLAERYACVPLFRVGKRSAVIAATGPLEPRALAIIAEDLDLSVDRLLVAVAPELRIRATLERVYNIPRPQRFLRAPGAPRAVPTSYAFPDVGVLALDDVDEPPRRSPQDTAERRRYVPTLGELGGEKEAVIEIDPDTDLEEIPDDDLPTVVDMIAAGRDREEVASLAIAVIRSMVPDAEGVVLFSLRGAIVVASASFRRDGQKLRSIALAMGEDNVAASALRTKALVRRGPDHTETDRRLLTWLGLDGGLLLAAPLITAARAISVLVVASRRSVDASVVETIASATAAGFARLMREAIE